MKQVHRVLLAFVNSGLKAIHAMRDGKKATRPILPQGSYYYVKDNAYWYFDGSEHLRVPDRVEVLEPGDAYYWYHLEAQLTEFTDWEIME